MRDARIVGARVVVASDRRLQVGYGVASFSLTGLLPLLPETAAGAVVVAVCAGAAACVAYGRRSAKPGQRLPWTLLLSALIMYVGARTLALVPGDAALLTNWVLNTGGDALLLVAALTVIVRRGGGDLGGVLDAAVIAFAAGSVAWSLLPHRLGSDQSLAAQLDLFVVVFAFTGALGALLRVYHTTADPGSALRWLLAAIALAIAGNGVLAIAGPRLVGQGIAGMLIMAAFTCAGLFGLDPASARLMQPPTASTEDRLSPGRLAFLGIAVAVAPAVSGIQEWLGAGTGGLLLTMQGTLVAALVMIRIGLLSAEHARAEEALQDQALHDPLTRLPNRLQFVTRLREALDRGDRPVLLFCDLDDFKSVNDRFGHDAGDALLIEVAERLNSCVRPPGLPSRFGGDEFVILLVNATDAQTRAVHDCVAAALARPFEAAGGMTLGVSIGVAPADGATDPEDLIRSADRAMYKAKAVRRS